jgi:hypothetical protein
LVKGYRLAILKAENNNLISVITQITAILENISVYSGDAVTLTCSYSGIYIEINKEEENARRSNILFLRINGNEPNPINTIEASKWIFDEKKSYYERHGFIQRKIRFKWEVLKTSV